MAVGFKVHCFWYHVGTGEFLHSFFSTVCYHLKSKEWGSKYKLLMNELYNGSLNAKNVDKALNELSDYSGKIG